MRTRSWTGCLFVASLAYTHTAVAQTGRFLGTISQDSGGTGLAGAEVILPDLKRSVLANYQGEFKFGSVPPGRHAFVVRLSGFVTVNDTVVIAAGQTVDREFVLVPQAKGQVAATQLQEVRVVAEGQKDVPTGLQEFEERRKAGAGHFIPETEMRANNERVLIDLIAGKIPGISVFTMRAKGTIQTQYLSSGRKCGPGLSILECKGHTAACPVTLYIDGLLVYNSSNDGENTPDLSTYHVRDYAAVEYYAGGATIPQKYNRTGSDCGVLLLWTRKR